MDNFLAKIYAENSDTLVLEACPNCSVNNIIKLSTPTSPFVRILGSEYVAISNEAILLFIKVLHKAKIDYKKRTSLSIIQNQNNDILITWDGENKQKININNLENVNIGLGLGFSDENLLNLLTLRDNDYLKDYKFTTNHTKEVFKNMSCEVARINHSFRVLQKNETTLEM